MTRRAVRCVKAPAYGMLHLRRAGYFCSRTLRNIQRRFMIDIDQAQRVAKVAANFFDQVENEWHLEAISRDLPSAPGQLHEIGLSVDFKQAPQHAAYLVRNPDLPGFTPRTENCWRRYCSTRLIRSILIAASAKCRTTARRRTTLPFTPPRYHFCQPSP